MANRLTVVIPAYNEEESLKLFLPKIVEHCYEKNYSLVVVNDGSTDSTREVIDNLSDDELLVVVHHKVNRGYGGAIKSGISAAKTEFVITVDADGQHQLDDIDKMFEVAVSMDADMVVGNRQGQGSSLYRNAGKWLIRSYAKILMPVNIYDINSGMKIYRADLAKKYLELCPDSMAYSDIITLIFINQRHFVEEVPIRISQRATGVSTVKTKTAFETIMEILNILVLFNPMRVFIPLSAVSIISGVIWGIPIVLRGGGVSVGAMLAIVAGLLFFTLGLIAEQLSMLRKSSNEKKHRI